MSLEIRLLGGFQVVWQGSVLQQFKPGKAQALLAYLLLHRDCPLPRSRVAWELWPDSTEDQARTNLRRELHSLKKLLPQAEECLLIDSRQLSWRGGKALVDVVEFEKGRLECYGGELLPGCYEEWLLHHRERLARRYRELLEQQVARQESQQDWREAISTARQLIDLDPLDEDFHRRLIRIYLAQNDLAGAQRAYQDCQRYLRQELDVEPSPATRGLLLAGSQPLEARTSPALDTPPLVGRELELERIRHWDSASLLLLIGEPGIGKTRLLSELECNYRGSSLWVRAYEAEFSRPFGPWLEAFRNVTEATLRVEGEAGPRARDLLFEPMVEWLRPRLPLQLLIDDLQWFDETSLGLLHYVLRLLGAQGLRCAATLRSGEADSGPSLQQFLRSLKRSGLIYEVPVEPLDLPSTRQLLAWVSPESGQLRAAERCGGNPLLALELAHSRHQKLEACLEERLERLSAVAREVVSWAAVLGRNFEAALLERSTGRGLFDLLPALEELEKQKILIAHPSGYSFRHDLLREVTYQQLSEPRKRLLHLHLARVLEDTSQDWSEIARHARLAGDRDRALRACLEAGRRSLQWLAFQEVQRFVREGLEQLDGCPEDEVQSLWRVRLLHLESLAGVSARRSEAMRQELTELLGRHGQQGALSALVYETLSGLAFDRHQDDQVETFSQRLAADALRRPADEAARWLAHSGNCLASIGRDMERAETILGEAQQLAERCDLQLVDLSLGWALVLHHRGAYLEARQRFEEALLLARQRREQWLRAQCLGAFSQFLLEMDEVEALPSVLGELEEVSRRLGEGSEGPFARAVRSLIEVSASSLDDSLQALLHLDARRLHAFLARHAARRFLKENQFVLAQHWSLQALDSARVVDHPCEKARARTLLIETCYHLQQNARGQEELRALRKESPPGRLCRAAQEEIQRLLGRWGGRGKEIADGPGFSRGSLGARPG